MASILLTPPAIEPLSLAETKAYLRVETADDDPLIAALIAAGRIHVERQTGLALLTQGWRLVLDCWPENGSIAVGPAPLQALSAARVFDFDGEARAVDLRPFVLDPSTSTLAFRAWTLPMPTRIAAGIEPRCHHGFRRYGRRCAGAAAPGGPPVRRALVRKPRRRRGYAGRAAAVQRSGAGCTLPDADAVSAPFVDIGALKRRLALETPVETSDGAGGFARSYEATTTLWAQVTPVSARGDGAADNFGAMVRFRIVIRLRGDITTRHRLREGARIYRIIAVHETADRRFLEIDAEVRED